MGLGISNLLVAALLGSGAFMQHAVLDTQQRVVSSSKRRHMASMFDEFGGGYGGTFSYPKRLGWSNRMVQRMATKRRNQKRNKQAHKGK